MENITKRATLLIVDDEPMSIEVLARVLEREYEVLAATNCEDASI